MQNTAFMHSLYTVYESNGQKYLLKLFVEEALSNKGGEPFSRAYELKDIEKIADLSDGVLSQKGGLTEDKSTTSISISDLYALVKGYDKDFKSQPSSKVVNADGTPKVVCLTRHWQKNQMVMSQCTIWIKIKPSSASGRLGYNSPGL